MGVSRTRGYFDCLVWNKTALTSRSCVFFKAVKG